MEVIPMLSLSIQNAKLRQIGLTVAILLAAAHLQAFFGGRRPPTPPSVEECFANSEYVVEGQVESVVLSESYESDAVNDHDAITRFHCDLAVKDVLYGEDNRNLAVPGKVEVGKTITVEQKLPSYRVDWRPVIGQEVLVYICRPKDNEVGARSFFYAEPLPTDSGQAVFEAKQHVEAVRLIGRVWWMITLGKPAGPVPNFLVEAAADKIKEGCSSDNHEYQMWCMRVLAGKAANRSDDISDQLAPIHKHFGAAEMSSLLQKLGAQRKDDYKFAIFCDDLLVDDAVYRHSNQRYEFLWDLVKYYRTENASENHNRLNDLIESRLGTDFSDRADDCLERLMKLTGTSKQNDRAEYLISMRMFFSKASKDIREKVLDFVEHKLQDAILDDDAVFTLGELAESDARETGKIPDRLKTLIEHADKLPQEDRWRLIEVRKQHPGLFPHSENQLPESK
jgi:hypothetical protein